MKTVRTAGELKRLLLDNDITKIIVKTADGREITFIKEAEHEADNYKDQ